MADDKWRGYLDLCHRFYFVAPPGVIRPDEVPVQAGLLVTTKNAARLLTKKRAPEREVDIPENLWRYILMCRTAVTREYALDQETYWRNWLATKKEKRDLGYNVGRAIAELVRERITKVEGENLELKEQNEVLAEAKKILQDEGISTRYEWGLRTSLRGALEKSARDCLPDGLLYSLKRVRESIEHAEEKLGELDEAEKS